MFFLNKSTGLIHEVTHEDHIKRCLNDSNYEEVKSEKENKVETIEEKKVEVKSKGNVKKTSTVRK